MPQMNEAALRGLLGLCQRAGKLQSGGDMALAAIRSGTARRLLHFFVGRTRPTIENVIPDRSREKIHVLLYHTDIAAQTL